MTTNVGSLQVELLASIGKFTESIEAARKQADSAFSGMAQAAGAAKAAMGFLGVGLSVGAFAASIKGAIDSLDALYDTSLRTGASVEALSAFRGVAKLSGTDMETLAGGIQKLSRAMAGSEEEGQKAAVVFQRLGISVKDSAGQLRPAEEVLVDVAKKLDGMESSTQRVAFAQQIFGKSGAQLLPFLKELAETGQLNAKITTEQAKAADQFNDNLVRLGGSANRLKIDIANALLPALNNITEAMLLGKAAGGTMFDGMIEGAKAAFQSIMRLNNAGDLNRISEDIVKKSELILGLERRQDRNPDEFTARRIALLRQEFGELTKRRDVLEGIVALEQPGALTSERKKTFRVNDDVRADARVDGVDKERAALQALQEQLGGITREMTEVDKVTERVTNGTWKDFSEKGKAAVLGVAGKIDAAKLSVQGFKDALASGEASRAEIAEEQRQYNDNALRQAQIIESLKQKYIAMIDPIEKYRKMLQEIDELQERGSLSAEQALEARARVQDDIQSALEKTTERSKETDSLAKQLGLTFSSAFENAIVSGSRLSDVIKGLGQDIARIVARKALTEPLANALTGSLGSLFGGGGGGGFDIAKLLGFADGGSFTVGGSGPTDSQVVAFRATPGEQVTVATPAQQRGGGGGVTVHINLSPGVPAAVRSEVAAMLPQITQAVVAGVVDAKRRGGALAVRLA